MMENEIVVYGHSWCFQVHSTRAFLKKWAIPYRYIDIREDAAAAEIVRRINQGYESVPTLVFPTGETLTEPKQSELKAKLVELGIEFPTSQRKKTRLK